PPPTPVFAASAAGGGYAGAAAARQRGPDRGKPDGARCPQFADPGASRGADAVPRGRADPVTDRAAARPAIGDGQNPDVSRAAGAEGRTGSARLRWCGPGGAGTAPWLAGRCYPAACLITEATACGWDT